MSEDMVECPNCHQEVHVPEDRFQLRGELAEVTKTVEEVHKGQVAFNIRCMNAYDDLRRRMEALERAWVQADVKVDMEAIRVNARATDLLVEHFKERVRKLEAAVGKLGSANEVAQNAAAMRANLRDRTEDLATSLEAERRKSAGLEAEVSALKVDVAHLTKAIQAQAEALARQSMQQE